jgi:hypothetical protein
MSERWQRELIKLREIELPERVWERAKQGPSRRPEPPPESRIVAAIIAAAVFLAGAVPAWLAFRPSDPSPPTSPVGVPDTARIVCTPNGATALTPEVRTRPDGVHVTIDNRSEARAFFIRDQEDPERNHGGKLSPRSQKELVTTFPPGELLVGCFANVRATPYGEVEGQGFARFRIVDPQRLWTPDRLACSNPTRFLVTHVGSADLNPDQVARESVPGVRPDDVLKRPGYPLTQWHVEPRVVLRNGKPIALLFFREQARGWGVSFSACPASGITPQGFG